MIVGFDVDDTVLFSSACYFYGIQKYSPGSDALLNNIEFWKDINTNCDKNYSLPKKVGAELIKMHEQRGDTIYFITGRTKTPGEQLTATLQSDFHLKNINPVVFAGGDDKKTPFLKELHVELYYGDADTDITQAMAVNARPIRVLRAANSVNVPLPKNGRYGEEVIVNSDK